MDKIEIPLSKTKILLSIGGSALLVLTALWLFTLQADSQDRFWGAFLKVISGVGIIFFGATGIYGLKKMFDKSMGLIIDEHGIIDNTNATSVGLIRWEDITAISTVQVMSTKFLLIFTNDPNRILDKVSGLKRKLMEGNMKMYGTPLSITSTALQCNFADLEKLLQDRLNEQHARMADR
ncbi:MAG: hypothetical protein H6555_11760 [Lewinellaceae bacterium]|nr:hypothetical protein [Lewinellaceae bacterium]